MFLEHLASDNGAGMHKYNTLYTRTLSWHVFTSTSLHDYNIISFSTMVILLPKLFLLSYTPISAILYSMSKFISFL